MTNCFAIIPIDNVGKLKFDKINQELSIKLKAKIISKKEFNQIYNSNKFNIMNYFIYNSYIIDDITLNDYQIYFDSGITISLIGSDLFSIDPQIRHKMASQNIYFCKVD